MMHREILEIDTKKGEPKDVTEEIAAIVKSSPVKEGVCNVYITATTAGFLLNENERMLIEDFRRFFNESLPEERLYHHQENAYSHLRASLLKQSITFPVAGGKLVLGQWQSILLWECDTTDRKRKIIVTVND